MQFKNLINVGSLSSLLLQTNYIFIAIQSGVNTGCETLKQLWATEKSTKLGHYFDFMGTFSEKNRHTSLNIIQCIIHNLLYPILYMLNVWKRLRLCKLKYLSQKLMQTKKNKYLFYSWNAQHPSAGRNKQHRV